MEQYPVVISVCGKPGTDATYVEFVEALHKKGFFDRFEVTQIALPVHHFRNEIVEHIREHGLASLFKFSIVMEDITTPGMEVDELEGVIEKFVRSLAGARRMIVVDPYLYGSSKDPALVSGQKGSGSIKSATMKTSNSRSTRYAYHQHVQGIKGVRVI